MACVMLTGEPPFFGTKCEEDSTGAELVARFLSFVCASAPERILKHEGSA